MLEKSNNLHIILISGKARSGKDTFADSLVGHLEYLGENVEVETNIARYAFANNVKSEARKFGWDGNKDKEGRTLLQTIGNSYREKYFKDIWVDALYYNFMDYYTMFTGSDLDTIDFITNSENERHFWLIITDCRYPNELEIDNNDLFFRLATTYGWNVTKDIVHITGAYNDKETLTTSQDRHPSEISLDRVNWEVMGSYEVINKGSKDDMIGHAYNFMYDRLKKYVTK